MVSESLSSSTKRSKKSKQKKPTNSSSDRSGAHARNNHPPIVRSMPTPSSRRMKKKKQVVLAAVKKKEEKKKNPMILLLLCLSFVAILVVVWQHNNTTMQELRHKKIDDYVDGGGIRDNRPPDDSSEPLYIFDFPPPDTNSSSSNGSYASQGIDQSNERVEDDGDNCSNDDNDNVGDSAATVANIKTSCQIQNETIQLIPPNVNVQSHFIIVGAQKSGTTALFNFLSEHPQLYPSNAMETHFFDWYYPSEGRKKSLWMFERNITTEQDFNCAILRAYWELFFNDTTTTSKKMKRNSDDNDDDAAAAVVTNNKCPTTSTSTSTKNNIITFEKTPSYMFLTRIPKLIHDTLVVKQRLPTKIIIILRNPINRAISQYRMGHEVKNGQSFDELVHEEIQLMKSIGLISKNIPSLFTTTSSSSSPIIATQNGDEKHYNFTNLDGLESLFQLSSSSSTTTKEYFKTTKYKEKWWKHYRKRFRKNYIQRSMYIIQLQYWLDYYSLNDKTLLVLNYEQFDTNPEYVYRSILEFVNVSQDTKHYIPKTLTNPTQKLHNVLWYKQKAKNLVKKETIQYLQLFFQSYNNQLINLLGEHWKNIW